MGRQFLEFACFSVIVAAVFWVQNHYFWPIALGTFGFLIAVAVVRMALVICDILLPRRRHG